MFVCELKQFWRRALSRTCWWYWVGGRSKNVHQIALGTVVIQEAVLLMQFVL